MLHNLSYVEDPTRAFRAIRFSERFGFKLSKHTENLIKSAIQMNLFGMLSGSRLYDELMLAFSETNPVRTLKRLADFGLLKVIHKNLGFSEKLEATMASMYETIAWYNLLYLEEKADAGILYLMALLSNLADMERREALERLSTPPPAKKIIVKSMSMSGDTLKQLPLSDPAAIYHLLKNVDIEITLFSMALTQDTEKKKDISRYLVELRKARPLLKGRDLMKLGIPQGPLYSKILNDLLDAQLRGEVKTADDEKKFVREHYLKRKPKKHTGKA